MLNGMRRNNAFIETHQHSEFHKSLMGLLLISIASLFFLFLETSSQFRSLGAGLLGNQWSPIGVESNR